jgi:hypothetical protein
MVPGSTPGLGAGQVSNEESMRDTRNLFAKMCNRKETNWDNLPPETIDDERMRVLLKLPRKQVAWDSSPMDEIFYKGSLTTATVTNRSLPLEWVVERMGEGEDQLQYFYVNNEGYNYARYAFRFTPRAV